MSPMSAPLDYAPTPRRRVPWRWVTLATLLIAGVLLWRYGKQLSAQSKLRWTVRQCTTYTRPADSVAYEENAFHAQQLVAHDAAYQLLPLNTWGNSTEYRGAYKPADPWNAFPAAARGRRLGRFAFVLPGATALPAVPLFIHTRTSKGRPERLVVVELDSNGLQGYVIDPGPLWGKPALIWQGLVRNLGENIPGTLGRATILRAPIDLRPGENIQAALDRVVLRYHTTQQPPARIYFGQVDPNDSAKFTIRVAISNTEFKFDGQLMPDDTIQIEGPLLYDVIVKIRDATPPSAPR
jgi:hypothetical protein